MVPLRSNSQPVTCKLKRITSATSITYRIYALGQWVKNDLPNCAHRVTKDLIVIGIK